MRLPKLPTVLWRSKGYALVRDPRTWGVRLVRDPHGAASGFPGGISFHSHLQATHLRGGQVLKDYDLGSGMVTNVGVLALANDYAWAAPSAAAVRALGMMKYHASGTGTVNEATTDIKLGTISTQGGQTPVAGTQVLVSAANLQKYQTVAVIPYTGVEAVTEWGLFANGTISATTGSPFTAGSATTGTVTGTPLTASSASLQGHQMFIFEYTAGGLGWGLDLSNTTSVVTVPAWYKVSDGTVATAPVNTDPYLIRPVMWDRRKFAAINVVNLDSISYTYTLSITAGG